MSTFVSVYGLFIEGMKLHLTIKPGASKNAHDFDAAGELKVRIAAPAVDGKANAALVSYLAVVLDLPRTKIVLLKGQTTRFKTLEILADEQHILELLRKSAI
jgi:uncharacterized protein (TIGR00251 family)